MAVKKFYAVKYGRTPGIYNNWNDCKAQIDGYSGAIYKGFTSIEEAALFMGWKNSSASSCTSPDLNTDFNDISDPLSYTKNNPSKAIAYVDGSYNGDTKEFSYGVVMFENGTQTHLSEKFNTPSLVSMRNVAGEIMGSRVAMEYALCHKLSSLTIYHDYEGISKWCLGYWKANKEGTIDYKKYYDSIKDTIEINFIKVKGHSGDKYNDLADMLAKQALGYV